VYLFPFINTKDVGPVVIEIPPADGGSITGTIMDAWQGPLEDVGPAGVDQGRGGKYLVLPPHYTEVVPDGYTVLPSSTYRGWAGLRSNLASGSDADVAKAVAYGKRVKVYPLSQAANPPATIFVDAIDVVYDNIIPYDLRFFELLDRFVQYEPWLPRDIAMIDILKTLGIEKGKPFKPDAKTQEALNAGAREAKSWFEARRLPALLCERALVSSCDARGHGDDGQLLAEAQRLCRRRARAALFVRLCQREAPRRRPVLSDDHQGQAGPVSRWRRQPSPQRSG
jgi:hypothetical protein